MLFHLHVKELILLQKKRKFVLMAISPSSYSPHTNKTQSNLNRYTVKDPTQRLKMKMFIQTQMIYSTKMNKYADN